MIDFKVPEGDVSLAGYTLENRIRDDGAGTFFAVEGENGERLLLKLVPGEGAEAEQQLATWQRSHLLRHRHLLDVRDVGRSELNGKSYIYGVFEYPDDVLASALDQGPLSEAETRDVLAATLAALRYLHAQGLAHGAVDPDHIVAVGDTVKLATDALRESSQLEASAEDVRQLGELVLSLRAPEPLGEPLATIVRHATAVEARERWKLAEISAVLEPPPAEVAARPTPPTPAPVVERVEPAARPSGALPKWILVGAAVVLLSILLFQARRKPEAVRVAPAAPAPVIAPLSPAPATAPPPSAMWRVIAFTYQSRDMAAKKAKQINSRWPDLRAAVFTPRGLRGFYLVALGNRMKWAEATRLQHQARSLGLPPDTYVQNYKE